MMKIKLYFILTIFLVLVCSITTAGISIKVAKYRGEKIEKLSKQLEDVNTRTEKFDRVLTEYLRSKNERQKIYTDLKRENDSSTDDSCLPDGFNQLWAHFAASQTCNPDSVNHPM